MTAASARGLFRATGKTAKPTGTNTEHTLLGPQERPVFLEREKQDFYPTPADPTRSFLAVEDDRLRDFDGIWEPACGDGAMLREMQAAGFTTWGSDLIDRKGAADCVRDFYDFKIPAFPAIVTNPPFDECNTRDGKQRWLYHALDALGVEYMALLLSWTWPGAGGLAPFWNKHPPARVYLMRWKIDFTGQGAPPMLNGWFVWDKAWKGETVLRMMDRVDVRQPDMFAEVA